MPNSSENRVQKEGKLL